MATPEPVPAMSVLDMTMELTWASWETIMRRTLLVLQSACSPAEFSSMLDEKTAAVAEISLLLASPNPSSMQALLTPWHSRATANAMRLRNF